MRTRHPLIKWLRLITLSDSSLRVRCNISGIAATIEFFIFIAFANNCFDSQSNLLAWCWILMLNVGLISGTLALSSAKKWPDRFAALGLLTFHFFSLLVLLFIGIFQKTMGIISIN
jgi:hypothetical protein